MTKALKYYTDRAERMIATDEDRNKAFAYYDKLYHNEWDLPAELLALHWVRPVRSTDPHDAIYTGVRVLSTIDPKITVAPLDPSAESKKQANAWEKNLKWQLKSANRRRPRNVVADIMHSALMYSVVAIQVVDLDQHIAQVASKGKETKQLRSQRRTSRFAINTFNPRDIHVTRNDFGPEAVLLCKTRTAQEVMDEWGITGGKLKSLADEDKNVYYFDYTDHTDRVVWARPADSRDKDSGEVQILRAAHDLDFFPWVALMGGSTLEQDVEDQYHPLLYSVYKSGAWETQNIVQTLYTSEVIAHAGSPKFKEEGSNPDESDVHYADPARTAKVPAGNTLSPLPSPPIDQALLEIGDRISANISRATVSQILLGGNVPSGTAYSAMNLATQTAMGSLKPAKDLAERALAEVFTLMLLWTKKSGKPLMAYGDDKRTDIGENYQIEPDLIAEDGIYIDVELTPDLPTDRLQRANAGAILNQLGYPREYVLDDVGVEDPAAAIRQSYFEKYVDHQFEMVKQADVMKLQMAQQAQTMQMQAQLQQQQMQEQQAMEQDRMMAEQQANMQAQAMAGQMASAPGGYPGGQGYNPGMGGMPAAMVQPGAPREELNAEDAMGSMTEMAGML